MVGRLISRLGRKRAEEKQMHQTVDASTFGCGIFCEPRVERVDPRRWLGANVLKRVGVNALPPLRSFVSAIVPLTFLQEQLICLLV